MLWLLFKAAEYSVESALWSAHLTYRTARYFMYGREISEEEKQLVMIREEISRMRQEIETNKEYTCKYCYLHLEHRPQRKCQCHDNKCPRYCTDHACFGTSPSINQL